MDGIVVGEYGSDAMLIGDWDSTHDTALSLNAGLDQEMPNPRIFSPVAIAKACWAAGTVITQATVDEAVKRLLRVIVRTGLADDPPRPVPATLDSPQHRALTLKTAEESIVLLKNEKNCFRSTDRKSTRLQSLGQTQRTRSLAVVGARTCIRSISCPYSMELRTKQDRPRQFRTLRAATVPATLRMR